MRQDNGNAVYLVVTGNLPAHNHLLLRSCRPSYPHPDVSSKYGAARVEYRCHGGRQSGYHHPHEYPSQTYTDNKQLPHQERWLE